MVPTSRHVEQSIKVPYTILTHDRATDGISTASEQRITMSESYVCDNKTDHAEKEKEHILSSERPPSPLSSSSSQPPPQQHQKQQPLPKTAAEFIAQLNASQAQAAAANTTSSSSAAGHSILDCSIRPTSRRRRPRPSIATEVHRQRTIQHNQQFSVSAADTRIRRSMVR